MKILISLLFLISHIAVNGQIKIEGYVFESGNRGYISKASVVLSNSEKTKIFGRTTTDESGVYHLELDVQGAYLLSIEKQPYFEFSTVIKVGKIKEDPIYLRHELSRKPGYIFEITLSEKGQEGSSKRAIRGALIEVYNNTLKRDVLVIDNLDEPEFGVDFIKGNHYTILVRRAGYLTKRMEAYVDVGGCILCFEGIGDVTPGVSDNLTNANQTGVLLANVELEKYVVGKSFVVENLDYNHNEYNINEKSVVTLKKLSRFIHDNPNLSFELGAHTDSRGKDSYNALLSQKRAEKAVLFLEDSYGIKKGRIIPRGYGESQLINNCKDGTNCTEEEHVKNRRTELMITKSNEEFIHRSLRQMKADELFDEILVELSQQGQIRIPEDNIGKHFVNKNETIIKSKYKNIQDSLFQDRADWFVHQATPIIDESKITESRKSYDPEEQGRQEIRKNEDVYDNPASTDVNSNFSGYKIVILFSRFSLSDDHPLYNRFPNLEVYTTADGNKLYMIETFYTKKEASEKAKKRYQSSFPNLYIVGFKNGIIFD